MKKIKLFNLKTGMWLACLGLASLAAGTARADYPGTVLGDSPLAYYALNPAADPAGTSPDLTGNGNTGVATNLVAAIGPTAYITNAANFNGAAAVDLSEGGNAGLLNFSGPITLEAWVQPSSSSLFGDIVAKGYDQNTYQEIVLRVNGPYGANYYGSSGSVGVNGGNQTTNWTYVVLSSDGTNCSLYVNGALVQRSPDTSGAVNFADDWVIGNGSSAGNTRFFNGNLSQVAIYNYGLNASQVLAHYYVGEVNAFPSNSAPLIVTQPQPQATYPGGTATFSVSAVSALAVTNQWLKNGSPISGQTGSTLTLNNVQAADATTYSVIVGNANGHVTSAAVSLSLFAPDNLEWAGSGNSGVWDTQNSANWLNLGNNSASVFHPGDMVLFNDTAGAPTSVTVNGTVVPSLITVNSSANNYNISGSGTISGSGGLVKAGSSTLTISAPGNFTGPVAIDGGLVYAGNNCFRSVASITITNNSTVDLGGGTFNTLLPVTVSGTGVNGEGAIYNSYNDYPSEAFSIALAGDAKFGGSARWDLASGSQISGPHNLTLDWSAGAGYGQWNTVTIGANVMGISVTNGSQLGMSYMDTSCQNPATTFTLGSGSQMVFYNGGFNGSIHGLSGSTVYIYTAPAAFNGQSLVFENGAQWVSYYNSGANTPINSAVTFNGVAHFVIGDHYMIYTNLVSGPGGFVLDYYNNEMVFSASNTYSGPSIIGSPGNSPALALTGNGSISHSSLIFFGGNNPISTRLDVTGRSDQTLTLASGQTLAGIGTLNGSLVTSPGSIVSPAGTNTTIAITTGANPVGTLNVNNNVTLNGTATFKLDGSGNNDQIQAAGTVTYGGVLNLVNISGAPFSVGDSFTIFNAAGFAGSFSAVTPPYPGPGLAWDLSQISSGIVNVIVGGPVISGTTLVNGSLILSGTGGTASGTYHVLTTTNLATPLANWIPVSTNSYDASGNFSVTNAVSSTTHQQFYQIQQ
jgi:autotransporter-associated beta strand protein